MIKRIILVSVCLMVWLAVAIPVIAQGPTVTVITSTQEAAEGYIFLAPIDFNTPEGSLLIMDDLGQTIFNQPIAVYDFKRQGNSLTYFNGFSGRFEVLNPDYQLADSWQAVGYPTDLHDLQILADGHALLLVYRAFQYDMSQIVPGGVPTATMISCVIQELDENKNLVWQWDSWDHIPITDTNQSLTTSQIDYDHCNAVEKDYDGNILKSGRHLDEVTKINRQTGEIMWRLGGKANEFTFVNDAGFALQHDIRRLPDGHITLFDNGTATRGYSRAVEYEINEVAKVITQTWEYRGPFSFCCGNAQRLPNGNTFINWGPAHPTITEVKPDGTIVFALDTSFSYRGFRFPWFIRPFYLPLIMQTRYR